MDFIILNRIPRTGSETLIKLFEHLGNINDFKIIEDPLTNRPKYQPFYLTKIEPLKDAKQIAEIAETNRAIYIDFNNYINFTAFDLPKLIYINIIRNPIERAHSSFYNVRERFVLNKNPNKDRVIRKNVMHRNWYDGSFNDCVRKELPPCKYELHSVENKEYDWPRQSLKFCGNTKACLPYNSELAIQIAKRTVDEEFAVVGTWDHTNATLKVLEKFIPGFFRGAQGIFYSFIQNNLENPFKHPIDNDVVEILKKKMKYEIDFYEFCKSKLFKQYISIIRNEITVNQKEDDEDEV